MNFPFEDKIKRVGNADLEELLRSFEDTWAESTGRRVTSAEFYDGYRRGENDSMYATVWATYYESWRESVRNDTDALARNLPNTLIAC